MFTAAGFERTWEYIDLFKEGLICTVSLSLLTVIFGFVLALLLAIMRLSNVRPFRFLGLTKDGHLREQGVLMVLSRFNPLSFIATVYVEVFRATPMLVQLFMIYYVVFGDIDLPSFKIFGTIRFERFLPGVIALSLNSGAYLSEIIRSGIQSIDGGQTEAARSLGLSQVQNMRFVIRRRLSRISCLPSPTSLSPLSRSLLSAIPSAFRRSCTRFPPSKVRPTALRNRLWWPPVSTSA